MGHLSRVPPLPPPPHSVCLNVSLLGTLDRQGVTHIIWGSFPLASQFLLQDISFTSQFIMSSKEKRGGTFNNSKATSTCLRICYRKIPLLGPRITENYSSLWRSLDGFFSPKDLRVSPDGNPLIFYFRGIRSRTIPIILRVGVGFSHIPSLPQSCASPTPSTPPAVTEPQASHLLIPGDQSAVFSRAGGGGRWDLTGSVCTHLPQVSFVLQSGGFCASVLVLMRFLGVKRASLLRLPIEALGQFAFPSFPASLLTFPPKYAKVFLLLFPYFLFWIFI